MKDTAPIKRDLALLQKVMDALQNGGVEAEQKLLDYKAELEARDTWAENYCARSGKRVAENILVVLGSNWVVYTRTEPVPDAIYNDWHHFDTGYWRGFEKLEDALAAKLSHPNECGIIEGIGEYKVLREENEKLRAMLKTITRQTAKFERLMT